MEFVSLIIAIYFAKSYFLRSFERTHAVFCFWSMILLAIPVSWLMDTEWNHPWQAPEAHWFGVPVACLTVPVLSFLLDLKGAEGESFLGHYRYALEIILGVPLWAFFWVMTELFLLGWIWI